MIKKLDLYERVCDEANFVIATKATIRSTALEFSVGKSTVHTDLQKRLPQISEPLSLEVQKVLDKNYAEKHLRGGEATKRKYLKL